MFSISSESLNRDQLTEELQDKRAGALVVFEGWVRNHNEGKKVQSLEYQIYEELAMKEGERILQEAKEKFNLHSISCSHRMGHLNLNELAVWIGATASHRDDAFKATRYVIDEIKHRLPVWKKEHYVEDKAEWVFCRHHHHHVHFSESDYYKKQSQLIDQSKLKSARVVVVGAGGLGCPVLVNLAGSGVGYITIVDFDKISISNIHRQSLYSPNLVGEFKARVAQTKLLEMNPFIQVSAVVSRVDSSNVEDLLQSHDLIIDCTDNMQTKLLLHDAAFRFNYPLITAGIYKFEGQIRTFVPSKKLGCLRCNLSTTPDDSLIGNCNDFGVLGVTSNTIGSIEASEAIQFLLTGENGSLHETIFMDLKKFSSFRLKNTKKLDCPCCAGQRELEELDFEISMDEALSGEFEVVDIRAGDFNLDDRLRSKKKIAICCHRGVKSLSLVRELRKNGHTEVFSVKGGACSH